MNFETLTLTTDEHIARLTLARPQERNAMTPAMGREIREAVDAINADDDVRCVVITGEGRSFCSGAKLATLGKEANVGETESTEEGLGDGETFYRAFLSIRDLAMPSVAAINGHAIGAGLCFALGADIRIMHSDAKVGVTFVKLGIHPGMAATWNLPRLVGTANAADLLYSGRVIGAEEALSMGLVNRVAGDDFEQTVTDYAQEIASAAPIAVRAVKHTLHGTFDRTMEAALALEAHVQAETFATEDATEGISAIQERRPPVFKGR